MMLGIPHRRTTLTAVFALAALVLACAALHDRARAQNDAESAVAEEDSGGSDGAEARGANPSGLPIPRWVSLRTDPVNLRTGPGVRYPIDWVLERKGLPVEVVGEYEAWRQIRLQDDTTGWVHQTMLSGRRTAIVADGGTRLLADPDSGAAVSAFVEPGVQGNLDSCDAQWCRMTLADFGVGGWIPRKALWGVYDGESVQ